MLRTLIVVCFLVVATNQTSLNKIVQDNFGGVQATLRAGRRSTPTSRIIAVQNNVFQRTVRQTMDNLGLERSVAVRQVREAVESMRDRHHHGDGKKPGGFPSSAIVPLLSIPSDVCNNTIAGCDSIYPYYTVDGTCNNLDNPFWGAANVALRRVRPAAYENTFEPRGAGGDLPSARLISTQVHKDLDKPDSEITQMLAHFGQFLDHDISLTPENEAECCEHASESECFPISVPLNDGFFSALTTPQSCLEFSRSSAYCYEETREQFNAITAFLDGSNIYGSDQETANKLREFAGGRLLTGASDLLPDIEGFRLAGDIRATEQPGLTSIHTVWMREHNRIAADISNSNPNDDDNTLFQKARRLVVAEWQNIVYSEWLPIIIGSEAIDKNQLKVHRQHNGYKKTIDPSAINSFATAAFRFGHTLIQGTVNLVSKDGKETSQYQLRDNYFNTALYLQNDGETMVQMLKGLTTQASQKFDQYASEDLTNHLFPEEGHNFGSDLIARNIQRGRDHGLPGYQAFRSLCDLEEMRDLTNRRREFNDNNWDKLSAVYSSAEDVDLFTGGLLESPVRGGVVGPTFACIIGQQFSRLLAGDRHFFTHTGQAGSLSTSEFSWASQRRLRDVLCDNTDIVSLQDNVFKSYGEQKRCDGNSGSSGSHHHHRHRG